MHNAQHSRKPSSNVVKSIQKLGIGVRPNSLWFSWKWRGSWLGPLGRPGLALNKPLHDFKSLPYHKCVFTPVKICTQRIFDFTLLTLFFLALILNLERRWKTERLEAYQRPKAAPAEGRRVNYDRFVAFDIGCEFLLSNFLIWIIHKVLIKISK